MRPDRNQALRNFFNPEPMECERHYRSTNGRMSWLIVCRNTPTTKAPRKPYTVTTSAWDARIPHNCPVCGSRNVENPTGRTY